MENESCWQSTTVCFVFLAWLAMAAREWGYTLLTYLYAVGDDDDVQSITTALNISTDQYSLLSGMLRTWITCSFMGIGGVLVSHVGAFPTMSTGLCIESVGLVIMGLSESYTSLLYSVVIIATGSGIVYTAVFPMLTDLFGGSNASMATGIALAGKQAGFAMASLSMIMAQSSLGWRGVAFLAAGTCFFSFIGLGIVAACTKRSGVRVFAEHRLASLADVWIALKENFSGFFFAIWVGMTLCAFADSFESNWIAEYFDDKYPSMEDEFSILNAIAQSILGTLGCVLGGMIVATQNTGVDIMGYTVLKDTAMLHTPALSCVCTTGLVVLFVTASTFGVKFAFYSAYLVAAKSYPVGIMLAVQLIIKNPAHKGVLLGLFLFTYWIIAAVLVTLVGDINATTGVKLLLTAPAYFTASLIFFVAGFKLSEYIAPEVESTDESESDAPLLIHTDVQNPGVWSLQRAQTKDRK